MINQLKQFFIVFFLSLFLIGCGGGSNKSGENDEPFVIQSFDGTISEEGGVLKLKPTFTQEDYVTGGNNVQLLIGRTFEGINPETADAVLSVEADLKITSIANSGNRYSTLRSSIMINDGADHFLMGLGLTYDRYNNGYRLTSFVERDDPISGRYTKLYDRVFDEEIDEEKFDSIVIEGNTSYRIKLEYSVSEQKVFGYVDGVKVVKWDFPDRDRQKDDVRGLVNVQAVILSRTASENDEVLAEGAFIESEVDNLNIIYDDKVLVSDNFNDNSLLIPQINFAEREIYRQTSVPNSITTELLTKNHWYVVKKGYEADVSKECVGKMVFNSNDSVLFTMYDDQSSAFTESSLAYSIADPYGEEYFNELEVENFDELYFRGNTSTHFVVNNIDYPFPGDSYIKYTFFESRDVAVEYGESLGLSDCSSKMPQ